MAIERTLSIIKPDAVAKNVIGQIYARFEGAGLKIVAAKMAHLSRGEAEAFYAVHKARPFFKDLVEFMISGPVMIQVLEGEGAIAKNRELMGATDPKKAEKGTIRADFADSIDANAVHGSDAPETAAVEVAFFFPGMNVYTAAEAARGEAPEHDVVNLLDFDLEGLAAFCEQLGEKRFRATQLFRWIHQKGAPDFDAMTDLAQVAARQAARRRRGARRCRCVSEQVVGRRHHQVAVRRRRRQRGRDRVHPRGRPRHAVRVVAGRLRGRLPLLLDRPPGLQPQPDAPARSSPSSGSPSTALRQRLNVPDGERVDHQRGDDGHGRAAAELRGAGAGAARDARRPRLRPVAPPRDGLDLGRGADDRPAARGLPGGAGGVAARARTTRCATTWCR